MFNLGKYFLPPAKSTFAHNIDGLFNFITNTGAILLLGIVIVMIYFVIKYRRRSEDDVTSLVDHNTPLEILWSIIPLILIPIIVMEREVPAPIQMANCIQGQKKGEILTQFDACHPLNF